MLIVPALWTLRKKRTEFQTRLHGKTLYRKKERREGRQERKEGRRERERENIL